MRKITTLILLIISITVFGQVEIPKMPEFDSTFVKEYNGKISAIEYFFAGDKVLEKDYISEYGRLDYPFSNGRTEDSCYAFMDKGKFDFYFFDSLYIINERFSYSSNIYHYYKYSRPNLELIEGGSFYIIKDHFYNIVQGPKYRIGKWKKYNNNKIIEEIDYDNFRLNGNQIVFNQEQKVILNLMKEKCDSIVLATFGKTFVKKHIVFNLDKSTYGTSLKHMRPEQPSGSGLLSDTESPVEFADICYDIKINDTLRFDAIMMRIDKDLIIIGEKRFENFQRKDFILCVGLDSTLNKNINKKATKFEKIAKENGFNFFGRDFYLIMEWTHTQGLYGKLNFIMEEAIKTEDKKSGWTTYYKRLRIDPISGKQEIIKDDKSSETIEFESIDFDL